MPRFCQILISLLLFNINLSSQPRTEYLLESKWHFTRVDDTINKLSNTDDSHWQLVDVPHDWAIYGPFSPYNDKQHLAIKQDGQFEATEHSGRTGGLPFIGVGWYRKKIDLPTNLLGKRTFLLFDGAMANAKIYFNGKFVGEWSYGYNSFHIEITDFIDYDNSLNVLAVRLENFAEQSRWYPGAGLYRNVHLVITNNTHIPIWGTYVTTPFVTREFAAVNIKTKIEYASNEYYKLITSVFDNANKQVAQSENILKPFDNNKFDQKFIINNPNLWDIDNPALYKAVSKLYKNDSLIDDYSTLFGIRTIEMKPDSGFYLNGKRIKFQGVCMHHDLGPLGTAVNESAIRRQIRILKNMGANAIRTSHNMPAPELVRAADEMGIMLMVETFDEWKEAKVENGYNRFWNKWAEKDMINVIHQFRNNPSVVMWCIGNEVSEQSNGNEGPKRCKFLQDICHREDPTRPVTNGMDNPDAVTTNNFAAIVDVAGFNYRPHLYHINYERLPQQLILGSETSSTISSRGIYKFPVERKSMAKYSDNQASSYDVEHCAWSNLPEDDFIQHDDLHYCIGEFVWTGFDYLGEPTPYYNDWPSHSSLFGIVDLAGIPKDRYYLYRSHWNKTEETLHILPHWNWEGYEGKIVPIFVYTNYHSAELFINGVSKGKRYKDLTINRDNSDSDDDKVNFKRQKRYRLMWLDTEYQAGTVKVVAYNEANEAVAEKTISTAGLPYKILLSPDRSEIIADGKDISFINVKIIDKNGNFCPNEQAEITIDVEGKGKFKAIANGNAASLESFQNSKMKLFSGQLTVLVQSVKEKGDIIVTASAKGVRSETIIIKSR